MVKEVRSSLSFIGREGCTRELRVPRRRRGHNGAHTPKEIVDVIEFLRGSAPTTRLLVP